MKVVALVGLLAIALLGCRVAAGGPKQREAEVGVAAELPVAQRLGDARAASGEYIAWREHIIDDPAIGGVPIAGGDGLAVADLDGDGHLDVVSVHESDTEYDGTPDGHVRVAFGTASPDEWHLATLVEGEEAGAPEDVAIGDVNRDGRPDVVVACELAHLIYLQNPGTDVRSARWARVIPPAASGRGSFIRVYLADFDDDGGLEVVTANKGVQSPRPEDDDPKPLSIFQIEGDPLEPSSWGEHVLGRVAVPINAQPVDLDSDGDADVVGGSFLERRIMWFENQSSGDALAFVEHEIELSERAVVTGFSLDFADLNADRRLDIVVSEGASRLVWLEQPPQPTMPWRLHAIGTIAPDVLIGFTLADIDSDGDADVIVGGYSRGPRDRDGEVTAADPLGRLAWFEHPDSVDERWTRHDISRRKRGMFDEFVALDIDGDADIDFLTTRGNSAPYDGVLWLEQHRSSSPERVFKRARKRDSAEVGLPP